MNTEDLLNVIMIFPLALLTTIVLFFLTLLYIIIIFPFLLLYCLKYKHNAFKFIHTLLTQFALFPLKSFLG